MQRTRRRRLALGVLVAVMLLVGPGEFAFASPVSGGVPRGDDICKLLTKKQVVRVLGRGQGRIGSPIPSDDACIWQTRPTKGRPVATVQLSAESLDDATEGYPDYLTALEEGTTAEYSPVSGLGDEAYAVRSVVTPGGSADGLNLVKDDVVLELEWTSEAAKTGSRRYDAIVASMRKALAKL
jgi:hypothetical protein